MDYNDNIMIALLPNTTDWSTIELPHLTLVFSGKIDDHPSGDFNAMAKDAGSIAMVSNPVTLTVMGVDTMGPPEDLVSAIIFKTSTELLAMRNFVEKWNRSEYDFRPHSTIGPYTNIHSPIPFQVTFDRISVCWGDDKITFYLKR